MKDGLCGPALNRRTLLAGAGGLALGAGLLRPAAILNAAPAVEGAPLVDAEGLVHGVRLHRSSSLAPAQHTRALAARAVAQPCSFLRDLADYRSGTAITLPSRRAVGYDWIGAAGRRPGRKDGDGMTRIAFIGAGSVEFTRNLLGDILTFPELAEAEIVLHDISAERLATAEAMARWTASEVGAHPAIEAQLDRRRALDGADFAINTIEVGGLADARPRSAQALIAVDTVAWLHCST